MTKTRDEILQELESIKELDKKEIDGEIVTKLDGILVSNIASNELEDRYNNLQSKLQKATNTTINYDDLEIQVAQIVLPALITLGRSSVSPQKIVDKALMFGVIFREQVYKGKPNV